MKRKYQIYFLAVLFGANILAWIAVFDLNRGNTLEVDFFDVGQGDAIFIETAGLQQILIDGGPNSAILEKLGKEMPFWDRTIDLIVLTHPEKDHMAGLIEVLERYKVENILWTGVVRETAEYDEWIKAIENEKAKILIAEAGQKIVLGGAKMEIIYPFENLEGKLFKDSNETSLVVKLYYGQNAFLFTGDIGKETENKLLAQSADVDSDVLKVGHHGSRYSSADAFIAGVSPKFAVIQVGLENKYGHPSQDVLERLKIYGIYILRTDLSGDIKFISNEKNIWLKI